MEWLLEGWKIRERKWYIWSFGWEGKEVRFWWGQEHQKSIFPFEEKTWEILVSFASVFTIIFLSSVLTYNVQHFNCYICPLICFVFFCPFYHLLLDLKKKKKKINVTFLSSYSNIHCLYIHVLCYSFSISKGPWFSRPTWKHLLEDSI